MRTRSHSTSRRSRSARRRWGPRIVTLLNRWITWLSFTADRAATLMRSYSTSSRWRSARKPQGPYDPGHLLALVRPLPAACPSSAQVASTAQPIHVDRTAGFHRVAPRSAASPRSKPAHYAPPFFSKSLGDSLMTVISPLAPSGEGLYRSRSLRGGLKLLSSHSDHATGKRLASVSQRRQIAQLRRSETTTRKVGRFWALSKRPMPRHVCRRPAPSRRSSYFRSIPIIFLPGTIFRAGPGLQLKQFKLQDPPRLAWSMVEARKTRHRLSRSFSDRSSIWSYRNAWCKERVLKGGLVEPERTCAFVRHRRSRALGVLIARGDRRRRSLGRGEIACSGWFSCWAGSQSPSTRASAAARRSARPTLQSCSWRWT